MWFPNLSVCNPQRPWWVILTWRWATLDFCRTHTKQQKCKEHDGNQEKTERSTSTVHTLTPDTGKTPANVGYHHVENNLLGVKRSLRRCSNTESNYVDVQPVDNKVVPWSNPHFAKKSRRFKDRRGSSGVVSLGPYSRFQVQICFHLGFGCFKDEKPSKTNSLSLSHHFTLNVFLLLLATAIQFPVHEAMGFLSLLV